MLTINKPWHLCFVGSFVGIFAPAGWIVVRLVFMAAPTSDLWSNIVHEVVFIHENLLLFIYMGGGTSIVLGLFGYVLGKTLRQLHLRASSLLDMNRSITDQKDDYEHRLAYVTNNLKNFHAANTNIQNTLDATEVIALATDSLHEILHYDRVILLMLNQDRTMLEFKSSRGSVDDNVGGVTLPFSEEAGILYHVIKENRIFLINDFRTAPESYRVQPPYDQIPQFRSIRFVMSPIEINGEVVGLFAVDNKIKKHDLDDTDIETVRLISEQISAALAKIKLFTEVGFLTRTLSESFSALLESHPQYHSSLSNMKNNTESMAHTIGKINSTAELTHVTITETSSTINEFTAAIKQVSESLEHVNEFMEETVSAISEINNTSREISENSNHSSKLAAQVKEEATKGEKMVAEGFGAWEQVSRAVSSTVDAFDSLQQDVDEIDHVLKVIDNINQRTKLLSLNAAIVSAQAGEHGKPFAVVAEEIRALSNETVDSATIIDERVKRVRASTLAAGDHFKSTIDLVDTSIMMGKKTGEALEAILASSMSSMNMANEIRLATQEQIKGTQLVSDSIEDLGEMVSQTAAASRQQAVALPQIVEAVEKVKAMAESVSRLTTSHQDDVHDVNTTVESIAGMIDGLFQDIEHRAVQNQTLLRNFESFAGRMDSKSG